MKGLTKLEGTPAKIDCGIIIITYNSAGNIERLLDSLPDATRNLSVRCVIIDNKSQDETLSIVRSRSDAELIEAGGNIGYAGAINVGRANIGPCLSLLILNPDIVFRPGAIADLYHALKEPGIGVTVPMLCNDAGTPHHSIRREPSLMRALGDAVVGAHWPRRPGRLSEIVRDNSAYKRLQDVDWATGAAILMSAKCNEAVGDWDAARFFLYSEETDFAARARRCGFRIRYVPTARAYHEGGGSGRSTALSALMAVNRIRYYEKYHGHYSSVLFRIIVALHHFMRSSCLEHRITLKVVLRRASWRQLPHGDDLGEGR